MKSIQLFLLLLPAVPVFSQNYHPFIQYGTYRDEFWAPELQICYFTQGQRYWFRDDTVVNGQTYNQLWAAAIQGSPNAPSFCPPYTVDTMNGSRVSLLREDLAAKKVYQLDSISGTAFLLFDFSAAVGDSVTVGNPPETVFVHDISSETWADGSDRKVLRIDLPLGAQTFWIEGLGAANDLWNPTQVLCICPHALCYQQNGQSLYGGTCATAVDSQEPASGSEHYLLTPNPASGMLSILSQGMDEQFTHVEAFNFLGELVLEMRFSTAVSFAELSIGHLPAGVYHLAVWDGKRRVAAQRFQKI